VRRLIEEIAESADVRVTDDRREPVDALSGRSNS
jgi:hypothetical protein